MTFDYRTYWTNRHKAWGPYRGSGSLRYSEEENAQLQRKAERVIDKLLRGYVVDGAILDCGCGAGFWLDYWFKAGGRGPVRGCDLVNIRGTPDVFELDLCADPLPLSDHSVVLASCLNVAFHLVAPGGWQHFVDEITRVVQPGGYIVLNDGNVSARPALHVEHRELAAYPWRMVEGPRPFRDTFVALFTP